VQDTMALVLAGGRGASLSVLSAERAESALPFGGKYRVVDFVLSNCCHSGIVRVGVLTQHAPTSLHDHIGSGRPWDLDRRDARVFILQPFLTRESSGWYRGTADALAQNRELIEESRVRRVLVLPGDHVYKMDYRELARTHEERGARVTIAVTGVPAEETRRFGMVTLADGDRVIALDEKPPATASLLASMGVVLFDADLLLEALEKRPVDLTLDVLRPMIESGERVFAHPFRGYWDDHASTLTTLRDGWCYTGDIGRFDERGLLYLADTESHTIRRIDLKSGVITTVVGTGKRGDGPDGDARQCKLARPHGIFVDSSGTVYVSDSESHRVRMLK